MARQTGLIKFKGTLDGLTFYKTKDGNLVRTKGGVDKERILKDPNFIRTRENMSEFATSASAGKLLRATARHLLTNAKDGRVTSRLTKVMAGIKNLDSVSARGERQVAVGLTNPSGLEMLKGFDFNERSKLSTVCFAPITTDINTGEVNIASITPINDLLFDSAATHVTFNSGYGKIDFLNNVLDVSFASEINLPIDGTNTTIQLTPATVPNTNTGGGNLVVFFQIQFFQEVNGVQYSLKNGAYNVLNILEIQ